jgi:hypothetical protein
MPELLQMVAPTELALRQALSALDWDNVQMHLVALGNSRLARHTPSVEEVMNHPALPGNAKKVVQETIEQLHGGPARNLMPKAKHLVQEMMQTGAKEAGEETRCKVKGQYKDGTKCENKSGFKWEFSWPMPDNAPTHDENGVKIPEKERRRSRLSSHPSH